MFSGQVKITSFSIDKFCFLYRLLKETVFEQFRAYQSREMVWRDLRGARRRPEVAYEPVLLFAGPIWVWQDIPSKNDRRS